MKYTRTSLWQLLLCLFLFASSLQCLDVAALPARPRQRPPANKGVKTAGRLSRSPSSLTAPVPRPEVFLRGQFVGVRVKSYEKGSVSHSNEIEYYSW